MAIDNTVIKVLNTEHGEKVIEWFKCRGVDTYGYWGNKPGRYYGVVDGVFNYYLEEDLREVKIIELLTEEAKELKTPEHYDNTRGSIYKFADDQKLNAWESDIIKRVIRCRKKGAWREDLEKTKTLIDLYILEYGDAN